MTGRNHEDELDKFREDFNTHVLNDKLMFNKLYRMMRRIEKQTITWSRLAKIIGTFFAVLEVINTIINLIQHFGVVK